MYDLILTIDNKKVILTSTPLFNLGEEMRNFYQDALKKYIYPGNFTIELIKKPVETESENLSKVLTKENVKDLINSVNFMYGHGHIYNELITKLQTLTNEQPKKYNLDKWFEGQKEGTVHEKSISKYLYSELKTKVIQLIGMEIVLFEDGTYYLGDTTGG